MSSFIISSFIWTTKAAYKSCSCCHCWASCWFASPSSCLWSGPWDRNWGTFYVQYLESNLFLWCI